MDTQQFGLIMGSISEVKTDLRTIREEQISQGKCIASVSTKIKAHSWIHRVSGVAFLSLVAAWLRTKFN